MGNGLIFAFVVALWAAYFVPLALRRYDEASTPNTIDKFSSLSRVVNPRKASTPASSVEHPSPVEPVETTRPSPKPAKTDTPVAKTDSASARLAARRRRRTLLTLIFVAVAVGSVTAVGAVTASALLPLWAPAIPVVMIVAWLVACRIQVRAERGIGATVSFRAKAKAKTKAEATDEEQTVILSGQFEDVAPGRKHVMEKVALEADALDERLTIAVPVGSTTGDALWDPLPVTLPTYVTKPRAGRTVRTIDFAEPNAWTSGHIEGEDTELPQRAAGRDAAAAEPVAGEERHAVGH